MHYDPNKLGAGQGGYWLYPDSSDSPPVGGPPGTPGAHTGAGTYPFDPANPYRLYPVGSYPGAQSPWGLLDGSGGLMEWLEGAQPNGTKLIRGSENSDTGPNLTDRLDYVNGITPEFPWAGIRIASSVPAPGTLSAFALLLARFAYRTRRSKCIAHSYRPRLAIVATLAVTSRASISFLNPVPDPTYVHLVPSGSNGIYAATITVDSGWPGGEIFVEMTATQTDTVTGVYITNKLEPAAHAHHSRRPAQAPTRSPTSELLDGFQSGSPSVGRVKMQSLLCGTLGTMRVTEVTFAAIKSSLTGGSECVPRSGSETADIGRVAIGGITSTGNLGAGYIKAEDGHINEIDIVNGSLGTESTPLVIRCRDGLGVISGKPRLTLGAQVPSLTWTALLAARPQPSGPFQRPRQTASSAVRFTSPPSTPPSQAGPPESLSRPVARWRRRSSLIRGIRRPSAG